MPVSNQPAVAPNRGSTDAAVGNLESEPPPQAIVSISEVTFSGHPGGEQIGPRSHVVLADAPPLNPLEQGPQLLPPGRVQ